MADAANATGSVGDSAFFGGSIGEVMVFNIAKSPSDIKSIYEATRWRYMV